MQSAALEDGVSEGVTISSFENLFPYIFQLRNNLLFGCLVNR